MDNKTTVLILGDARNNYNDPKAWCLRDLQSKAKNVIWLNPESPSAWGFGDSVMDRYMPYCDVVEECRNLRQLSKIVDQIVLLKHRLTAFAGPGCALAKGLCALALLCLAKENAPPVGRRGARRGGGRWTHLWGVRGWPFREEMTNPPLSVTWAHYGLVVKFVKRHFADIWPQFYKKCFKNGHF